MTRVLIVGAGPTGLAAGVELARHGILPTIIDRRHEPSGLSRAVGITPRSLALLAPSGVADAILEAATPLRSLYVYSGSSLSLSTPVSSERAFVPHLMGLAQDETEAIMRRALRAKGVGVRYGVALERIHDPDAPTAHLSDGSSATFDYIVGADGVGSTTRAQAGIDFPGYELGEEWSIADVDLSEWRHPDGFTLMRVAPGIVAVVVPLGGARFRVLSSTPDALEAASLPLDVTHEHRTGTFQISVRQAETYSAGRVHLAGDAAHCHSPVGGRGMNLGIADGVALAKRIASGDTAGYSLERHPEAAEAIRTTERARHMLVGRSRWQRAVLDSALLALRHTPALRRRMARFVVEF
ncbi:MAG: NAD(P)/FAD-dependent oxidoreductase [Gemmatimonadota bacterium]